MVNENIYKELEEQALRDDRVLVVDCVLTSSDGKIFVQKRSPDRRMFPGLWEIPGGHVDKGESIPDAIIREIKEELNLDVTEIVEFLGIDDYEIKSEWRKVGDNPRKRSIVFRVSAIGDLRLEEGRVSEAKWIGEDELNLLTENRDVADTYTYRVVKNAFERMRNAVT